VASARLALTSRTAIRSHIRRTPYSGRVTLSWRQTSSSIRVLPATRLARIFTLPWPVKLLLTLFLVYPVLVLCRRLFLGAHYDPVRCTYALTRWVPLVGATEEATRPRRIAGRDRAPAVARLANADGDTEDWILQGETEDLWLARWREALTEAVQSGAKGPLRRPAS
jgi:hypothetical protein